MAKEARAATAQDGAAAEPDENDVREREAALDELVAEAQKHDMGYKRARE